MKKMSHIRHWNKKNATREKARIGKHKKRARNNNKTTML